jgi:hypothetical protein
MIDGAAIMGRDVMVPSKYRAWMAEEGCKSIFFIELGSFSSLKHIRPREIRIWSVSHVGNTIINRGRTLRFKTDMELVVDIVERKVKVPIGPWDSDPRLRRIGTYMLRNLMDGARGFAWKMLRACGLAPTDIESLILEVKQEARRRENHPYIWM